MKLVTQLSSLLLLSIFMFVMTAASVVPAEKSKQETLSEQPVQPKKEVQKNQKGFFKIIKAKTAAKAAKKGFWLQYKTNQTNPLVGVLIGIGVIFLLLGIFFIILISILIGAILMVLGLLSIAVGAAAKQSNNNATNSPRNNNPSQPAQSNQMQDVVYLKNGSMIKGIIVEQIVGQSLKIEIPNGSVFFYKMDEVEKIAKERMNN